MKNQELERWNNWFRFLRDNPINLSNVVPCPKGSIDDLVTHYKQLDEGREQTRIAAQKQAILQGKINQQHAKEYAQLRKTWRKTENATGTLKLEDNTKVNYRFGLILRQNGIDRINEGTIVRLHPKKPFVMLFSTKTIYDDYMKKILANEEITKYNQTHNDKRSYSFVGASLSLCITEGIQLNMVQLHQIAEATAKHYKTMFDAIPTKEVYTLWNPQGVITRWRACVFFQFETKK